MEKVKKVDTNVRIQLANTKNQASLIQKKRTQIDSVSKATLLTYIQS